MSHNTKEHANKALWAIETLSNPSLKPLFDIVRDALNNQTVELVQSGGTVEPQTVSIDAGTPVTPVEDTRYVVSTVKHLSPHHNESNYAFHKVGWPEAGDKMIFLGTGGYDSELTKAKATFEVGQVLTVKDCDVGDWSHSIKFEEHPDRWNGVMFHLCSGEDISLA